MAEIALLLAAIAATVAVVAIIVAQSAQAALREVERRLRKLERPGGETGSDNAGRRVTERVAAEEEEEGEVAAAPEVAEAEIRVEPEPRPAPAPVEPQPSPVSDVPLAPVRRPSPQPSLEERLGGSLPIWFGAVALAFAGVFLVKHFVERGLLGPEARVGVATFFGFALLGLAWWIRARRSAIAEGLAAAGVAVLSGATYAASALYGFLSPFAGVVVQGLVTALAIAASLRFGPFVALLGLVGGFAMPALIGAGEMSTGAMFGYLALLQVALATFGRRQGWWWLPVLGTVAAFVWAFAWQDLRGEGFELLSPFVLLVAATAVVATRGVRTPIGDGPLTVGSLVPWLVSAAALAVLIKGHASTAFAVEHWLWTGVLCAGCLVLAARDRVLAGLPWLTAVVVGVWLFASLQIGRGDPHHDLVVLGYGLMFTVGPFLVGFFAPAARAILAWLPAAAVCVALRALVAAPDAAWRDDVLPGLVAAVALAVLAFGSERSAVDESRVQRTSGLWAAAALAMACGLFEAVATDYRAAALAPLPVILAVLGAVRRLRPLIAVALGLSLAIIVVLVADQMESWSDGSGVFWSAPSITFGVVALSTFAASRIVHRGFPGHPSARAHQTLAIGLAATEVLIWIWRFFEGVDLARPEFLESATVAVAWLVLGQALFRTAPRWAIHGRQRPGSHVTFLGLAVLVLLCGMATNPLFVPVSVGTWPVLNGVLLAFGCGGVLALLAARSWSEVGAPRRASIAAAVAFLSGFALVSLEVRQAFQGDRLVGTEPSRAEWYAYSVVWLVYGISLLIAGIVKRQPAVRYASLVVMLAAVVKVFLFDASNLDGLWRVLSFFGLGVSLMGLAWIYQRFVVAAKDVQKVPGTS